MKTTKTPNLKDSDTILLSRKQLRQLMCDSAIVALDIEQKARSFITVKPDEDIEKLIRESVAGIAGDLIANKAFKTLN